MAQVELQLQNPEVEAMLRQLQQQAAVIDRLNAKVDSLNALLTSKHVQSTCMVWVVQSSCCCWGCAPNLQWFKKRGRVEWDRYWHGPLAETQIGAIGFVDGACLQAVLEPYHEKCVSSSKQYLPKFPVLHFASFASMM